MTRTIDLFDEQEQGDVGTAEGSNSEGSSTEALVPIRVESFGGKQAQTVNARDLWRGLDIGKDFSNWMRAQIKRGGFQKDKDYGLAQKGEPESLGNFQQAIEYHFTINAGKHICMMSQKAKGREIRGYFIRVEEEYRSLVEPAMRILPANYASALRELAIEVETAARLRSQNEQLEEQRALDAPKVELHDQAMSSEDCLAFGEAAKILDHEHWGQNRLFDFCRSIKLIQPKPSTLPYQASIVRGYFEVIEQAFSDVNGRARIATKTLITQKGLAYIQQRLCGVIVLDSMRSVI